MPEPLTPAERQAMAELAYREAMTGWQENEDERVAQLAVLAPLEDFIDLTTALPKLENLISSVGDFDLKQRINRVRQILANDYGVIVDRIRALSTPAPLPTMAQIDFPPAQEGGDQPPQGGGDDD